MFVNEKKKPSRNCGGLVCARVTHATLLRISLFSNRFKSLYRDLLLRLKLKIVDIYPIPKNIHKLVVFYAASYFRVYCIY